MHPIGCTHEVINKRESPAANEIADGNLGVALIGLVGCIGHFVFVGLGSVDWGAVGLGTVGLVVKNSM